jgi:hypothetical protein
VGKFLLCVGAWIASGLVFVYVADWNEWIATLVFPLPILLTAWALGSGEPGDERRVVAKHAKKPTL